MNVEIRPARQEEMGDMGTIGGYVYGGSFGDGPDNVIATANRPEWSLCAFVDGEMVATFVTIPFTMRAVGKAVALGGIGTVGTKPQFRRKGLLRRLMTKAIHDMRDREQVVAALWASQAAIYQRYQFAMTSVDRSYEIDTADIGFHDGNDGTSEVVMTPVERCFDELKSIYRENVARRICYLHRSSQLWRLNFLDERPEDGPVNAAICRNAGGAGEGYVIYTLRAGKVAHRSRPQQIKIRELVSLNTNAYRSIWRFIASHDLVGSVRWNNAPIDDPAPELFIEPRLLHVRENEGMWFRMIDVERALEQRGYLESGELRLAVQDQLAPWNQNTFDLSASPDGARATATQASPDLTLSVKALASLYTGFRSASTLSSWGLIEGDSDKVALADRLFRTPHMPHCPDHF